MRRIQWLRTLWRRRRFEALRTVAFATCRLSASVPLANQSGMPLRYSCPPSGSLSANSIKRGIGPLCSGAIAEVEHNLVV